MLGLERRQRLLRHRCPAPGLSLGLYPIVTSQHSSTTLYHGASYYPLFLVAMRHEQWFGQLKAAGGKGPRWTTA